MALSWLVVDLGQIAQLRQEGHKKTVAAEATHIGTTPRALRKALVLVECEGGDLETRLSEC